jgi:hypothetical protein
VRLKLSPANLKLAVATAISKWRNGSDRKSERYFHKLFTKQRPSEEDFTSWLGLWMIARNSSKKLRPKLRNALWKHSRQLKNFRAGDSAAYKYVDKIANELGEKHLSTGRPLSLVSKFAFALNPDVFFPFDSRVREALHRLGHPRVKLPYSYEVYMKCVNRMEGLLLVACCRPIDLKPDRMLHE